VLRDSVRQVDARLLYKTLREACVRSQVTILEGADVTADVSTKNTDPLTVLTFHPSCLEYGFNFIGLPVC
jgi:hypothetical protein